MIRTCYRCGSRYKATDDIPESVAFIYPAAITITKYDRYYLLCPDCLEKFYAIFNEFIEEGKKNERQS